MPRLDSKVKKLIAGVISLLLLLAGVVRTMNQQSSPEIKIAFAGYWKSTHPGLQHTLVGDLTLSNQFDALVGFSGAGIYVPLAAKEWTISPDFKTFRFVIDTSRKFSDGVPLSARDFKASWENSYRLDPKSSNSSLLDVLYKIEGFSDFGRTGTISGIRVVNNSTLEVRFTTPFRMALEHLSGNRFSAYREVAGKFLGTGAYVIEELKPELLRLTPNPYFPTPAKRPILLSTVGAGDAIQAVASGSVDVVAYAMGAGISETNLKAHSEISTLVGQDALHRALYMNGQKGRLFENRQFRQALQYLIFQYVKNNPTFLGSPAYTSFDMQVYLPLQAGRIEESEVEKIVEGGKRFVPDLLSAAQQNPPVLIETADNSMKPVFEAIGVPISQKSRTVDKATIIDMIYKGEEADLIPGSFGVASGDPDGIYHKLGKTGAIASPMTNNEAVAKLLEQGREIVAKDKLDPFYKTVSRKILEEAPLVHLGFNKAVALYRNDRIKVEGELLRRNEGHLHIFEAR